MRAAWGKGIALVVAAATTGSMLLVGTAQAASPTAPTTISAASWRNWYVPPSLRQLRSEVDARWPGRSRASDGTIGDVYHSAGRSEHNPVGHPNGPVNGTPGAIHAMDITAATIDPHAVVQAAVGDPRVWYVIYNSSIWSRTTGWAPRYYFGDPHRTHVHISLRSETQAAALAAETDTRSWFGGVRTVSTSSAGSLGTGTVQALQRALITRGFAIPAGPTGYFGDQTRTALAAFQRSQGWFGTGADGTPGPETMKRLGLGPTSAPPEPKVIQASAPAAAPAPNGFTMGATSEAIRNLQRALISRGYAIAAGPTGYYGQQTRAAVSAFQRAQGWSGSNADGIPGAETLRRLGLSGSAPTSSAPPKPTVVPAAATTPAPTAAGSYSIGARGSHIVTLQNALISRGFGIPAGATGFFGSQTQSAVAAFQRAQGWSGSGADGIPGPTTLRLLGSGGSAGAAAVVPAVAAVAAAPQATAAAAPSSGIYVFGARNDSIVTMQRTLIKLGFSIPAGPTGLYGNETKAAVAAFQRSQGWSGANADGIPGPATLARLGLR